jgi:competence protein ComEC
MDAPVRPLVLATLLYASGLAVGLRTMASPSVCIALAVVVVLAAAMPGSGILTSRRSAHAVWTAFVLVGVAMGSAAARDARLDCRALLADGALLRVEGRLAASAITVQDRATALLPLYASSVAGPDGIIEGCTGVVRVRLPDGVRPSAGSAVSLDGEWMRSAAPVTVSAWPREPRFAGFLRVDSAAVAPSRTSAAPLLTLRGRTEAHLHALFPTHGPLAEALLLGRRERVDPGDRERFARAGMAHLLAISGMHVGLIAGMILLAGSVAARVVTLPPGGTSGIAIGGILGYLLVIGAPPSAVRAGVMICLALVGVLLQRPYSPYSVVAAAALPMLALRPMTLLEPGFQLSFLGTIGIIALRSAIFERLPECWTTDGWRRWTTETTVVSVAAFVATAPVVVWHFGLLAPIGLLSNLVAIPVLGLSLAGLVTAALSEPIAPPLARLLALGTEAIFFLLDRIADWSAGVPYGHVTIPRPDVGIWVAAGLMLVLTARLAARYRGEVRWVAAVGAALTVLFAAPAVSTATGATRGHLELHFLDVGQGDAIAIRTPGDRWVLVDAGPASDRFDAGERRVLPFLRAHGVRRIEAMVLTHPHLDHIGGASAVLRALPVGALIEPGHVTGSSAYLATLRTAEERGVAWRAARSGRTLEIDGVRFEFLWPDAETIDAVHDANEISAILRVRYGAFAALLTGDAYSAQEMALVQRHGVALRSQILKAGHHGSYTSTSAPWLDAVRPELVVISAGRRNRFGHPAPEVVSDLQHRGIAVARTDRQGTVTVRVDARRPERWTLVEP